MLRRELRLPLREMLSGMRLVAVVGLTLVMTVGCSRDGTDDSVYDEYVGSMLFDFDPLVIGRSFTDTVRLTIDDDSYSFETLVHTVIARSG